MKKSDLHFGIEIEYLNAPSNKITRKLKHFPITAGEERYDRWIYKKEVEITKHKNRRVLLGGEVASRILTFEDSSLEEIKQVLDILKKHNADVDHRTALQYHISLSPLERIKERLETLMKLIAIYEHVIYKVGYNGSTPRKNILAFANPSREKIIGILDNKIDTYNELLMQLQNALISKCYGINLGVYLAIKFLNTIEFRMCNGSLDYKVLEVEINLFCNLVLSCIKELDKEFLDYKFKNIRDNDYSKIYLSDAEELTDILGYTEKEKEAFIYQYMKK